MTKFLELSEYGIGSITLPYLIKLPENCNIINDEILSDHAKDMINISIEDNTDSSFFIDLLKVAIDAVNHIPDTERKSIQFYTADQEICKLKIITRHIIIEFYSVIDEENPIFCISTGLNLKSFVESLLNDYKILTEKGLLKSFTNQDRGYMQIINKYYQQLEDLYETSL